MDPAPANGAGRPQMIRLNPLYPVLLRLLTVLVAAGALGLGAYAGAA